ncbi:hypothetical protein EDF22_0633 [Rathayibacter sp. PhB127]|nr:hypothetical protein EDF22_0633 [Rathayibacter sp. PhB127]
MTDAPDPRIEAIDPCVGCGEKFVPRSDETCSPACWQKIKAGVTL